MSEQNGALSPDLYRQRRNLLITSVILWSINFTGLKIDHISFAGIDANFDKNFNVFYLVFFFWVYFLIRYYQYYCSEEKGVRFPFQHFLNRESGIINKKYQISDEDKLYVGFDNKFLSIPYITLDYEYVYNSEHDKIKMQNRLKAFCKSYNLCLHKENKIKIPALLITQMYFCATISYSYFLLKYLFTRSFTDYWLPFLFSLALIIWCHGLMWDSLVFWWEKLFYS